MIDTQISLSEEHTRDVDYRDPGGDYFTRRDSERAMHRIIHQANALGFTVRLDQQR